jgi:hypothetical protein
MIFCDLKTRSKPTQENSCVSHMDLQMKLWVLFSTIGLLEQVKRHEVFLAFNLLNTTP